MEFRHEVRFDGVTWYGAGASWEEATVRLLEQVLADATEFPEEAKAVASHMLTHIEIQQEAAREGTAIYGLLGLGGSAKA